MNLISIVSQTCYSSQKSLFQGHFCVIIKASNSWSIYLGSQFGGPWKVVFNPGKRETPSAVLNHSISVESRNFLQMANLDESNIEMPMFIPWETLF